MAYIQPRKNKAGEIVSYRIKVSNGYSADGTTQHTQSMTWKPPKAGMSEKQIQKALAKAAADFEQACAGGQVVCVTKFENFCEEWLENYASRTLKPSGVERCIAYTPRVYAFLGHMRLDKITPREIDNFISWLCKQHVEKTATAVFKGDFKSILEDKGLTQKEFSERAGVSPQTIKSVISYKVIKWENAEKIASVLGKPADNLFEKAVEEKALSPKTVKNYISFVSSVFDYAIRMKMIKENPCKNAALPKIPQAEHTMFTIDEAKKFLDILEQPDTPIKYKAFFQLAIFGGFRRGEILGLEWGDVDFDSGMIHIRRTVHHSKELGYYDTTPKSEKSVRSLTLPPNVLLTVKQLKNEQLSQRLRLGDLWNNTNRLFTTWDGHQMNGATPFTWLTKTCEQNNLPKVNLHSFRHLNASLLISSGIDVKTVQSVLGHSQASTTLDIYAAAFREREAQALGVVANILNSDSTEKRSKKA